MGLVGLNRIELFTGMHPYFNQTWGYMATPFSIVLAWHVVRRRTRGGLLLFAAFLGILAFAYPLALPIPLIAAIVFWGFERRRRGLPLIRRPRLRSQEVSCCGSCRCSSCCSCRCRACSRRRPRRRACSRRATRS